MENMSEIVKREFGDMLLIPGKAFDDKIRCSALRYEEMSYLSELCDKPKIVYYPGCGADFTPIYFLDAKTYVYQDIGYWPFPDKLMNVQYSKLLCSLLNKELVRDLKIKNSGNKFTFETKNIGGSSFSKKRLLELFYGSENGDMNKYTPKKARKADITYLDYLNLSIGVVPNLKIGSIIRSSVGLGGSWYFDLPKDVDMEQFGLETILIDDNHNRAIFRKIKQVSHEETKRLKHNACYY
ncbi:MAG: hypothetical protein PHU12_01975 [Candidatus Aenigmarchaeota archaeon]|nr:hypothetical protein [Candidatus Aenigmarchaeota archaeon]